MRQLLLDPSGALGWTQVPEPDLQGPGEALVRPLAVATCDLDGPIIRGETPLRGPIALGHECVGEVVAVGSEVSSVRVGDHVVVPFQISCGTCPECRRGLTGSCSTVPPTSMYGFGDLVGGPWGGMLADLVRVPYADAMLVAVPDGVAPEAVASASDNLPDAWRTVAPHLAAQPGADVLVLGGWARSIGLYAVGLARALGAGRVAYLDADAGRRDLASDLGAEILEGPLPERTAERYPIVVDAGATAASLRCACRSTAPGGNCTHVGLMYEPLTEVPVFEMYVTGVHLHVGRAMARAAVPGVLATVASGGFDPARVTDRVLAFEDAPTALLEPHTKLVFRSAP